MDAFARCESQKKRKLKVNEQRKKKQGNVTEDDQLKIKYLA